jgi:hypothetical protein
VGRTSRGTERAACLATEMFESGFFTNPGSLAANICMNVFESGLLNFGAQSQLARAWHSAKFFKLISTSGKQCNER